MQIKDSKFHKVWKIVNENGMVKVDLGDSRKNKDGGYDNFTWFGCLLIGEAKNVQLKEKDTVTINEAVISQYKNKDGKYMPTVTIFKLEVTKNQAQNDEGFVPVDASDDDIPF